MSATTPDAYRRFIEYHRETSLLASCAALLGWDQDTYMPRGGAEIRAQQLALLRGMAHRRTTGTEYSDLLAAAEAVELAPEENELERANLREARREHDRKAKIPAELVEEQVRATVLARRTWVDARKADDFSLFLPHLEKIFELAGQVADAIGFGESRYDALLDGWEPGATEAQIRALFDPLREAHLALLDRILGSRVEIDTSVVHGHFPKKAQERLCQAACEKIGFDFRRGRIDVTAHPFCSGIGPDDVRLTTRYDTGFFNPGFFGVMHEAGHGMYEQGLSMEHHGTPMAVAVSYGIHESQSRLWENLVARSRSFWRHLFPMARDAFPEALGGVEEEPFWRAVNDVRPSLIRVEADEVTYNLHIMLRFELERDMLTGELEPRDLPGAWNEAFRRYLRIEPPSDADGCLQDIHWSAGLIGYFPTYTLGNVYAAQIFEAAERDLGDLDPSFERGEFRPLGEWLHENVHRHGRRFSARALIERVSGAPPAPDALLQRLARKFEALYPV